MVAEYTLRGKQSGKRECLARLAAISMGTDLVKNLLMENRNQQYQQLHAESIKCLSTAYQSLTLDNGERKTAIMSKNCELQ